MDRRGIDVLATIRERPSPSGDLPGQVLSSTSSGLSSPVSTRGSGESASQPPLKDQAFSTFLDQDPPFELPPENGISPSTKACPAQWPVIHNTAIKRPAS